MSSILEKKQDTIVKKWFNAVVDTYPQDTRNFMKGQKDPFANPVGQTTLNGLKQIFAQLITESPDSKIIESELDPIIRIRAVQNFTPSKAVSFIFDLKKIVKDAAGSDYNEKSLFEERVDIVALIGFDIYMRCREKIYELKANFEKNSVYKAFERAGLMRDTETKDLKEQISS